ncbi:MAG: hypothetical protein ACPL28_12000 [bacterium]
MRLGTIKRLLNYYFASPQYFDEILRALKSFFGNDVPPIEGGEIKFRNEEENALFNEWFVYDFKLSNGKTPLENFYERNPYNLKNDELQIYKDLQENVYSYFKVIKKILGTGLVMEDVMTGRIYEVKEYSLTFEVYEGQSFPTRVGRVEDHYEIVGGNIYVMPVKLSPELELSIKKSKEKWNPKMIWEDYIKNRKTRPSLDEYPTFAQAEKDLDDALKKYDLDKFVSVSLIKDWIYNEILNINKIAPLILSLLIPEHPRYHEAIDECTKKLRRFNNVCPQKKFGGKSPFDMMKESQKKGVLPDFRFEVRRLDFPEIHKKYHEFIECLSKKRDYKKGLRKINEIFKFMLENKIAHPEIYRLYANKATCHLALDNFEKGKFFLKIATKLNPYYNFPQRQLQKLEDIGYYFEVYVDGYIERDPAYQYYNFLIPLKINFAHKVEEVIV